MATIKKLVKFAAKFLEMAKAKGKDKKKVAAKAKSKPVAKKASAPAKKVAPKAKKAAKAVAKAKPVAKKAAVKKAKPVVKKKVVVKAKPVAAKKAVAKPAAKVVKKAAKPAPKVAAKPVAKPSPKPVAKAVAKPVAKPVVKAVAKPIAKPVAPKAPVQKPTITKPGSKPAVVTSKPEAQNVAKPIYKTVQKNMEPEIQETHHRYSDEDLKEFKDLIDKKLVSAREELKNLKESLDNHTESQAGNKAWNMEEGTDTSEMEYLMNQIARQHQYIRNLELALVRVENKTYGICRATGKLIPKERLRIVPHATLSLEAKMTRKKEDTTSAGSTAPPSDFSEGFED